MTRTDTLQVDSNPMDVYLAFPEGPGPHPGVVVMHHRHGLDRFTRVIADRLAEAGFCAAAPDKYHRSGGDVDRAREEITDRGIIADVAATVDHLMSRPGVDSGRLGIVGHCMGGRTALVGAATNAAFGATAIWYGGNVFKSFGEGPTVFELLGDLRGPVAGFYGNDDRNPSPDDVNRIDAELTRLGIDHEFHRYDGAGHAFMNDESETAYREQASNDSWNRAMEFLQRELAAG